MAAKKKTKKATIKKIEENIKPETKKPKGKKKVCPACHEDLPLSRFYVSNSPLHSLDRKTPICKECALDNSINHETGEIDEVKFKNILRQLDKPFYLDNLISSENEFRKINGYVADEDIKYRGKDILRIYFKNCNSLHQYNHKTFEDSERDGFVINTKLYGKKQPDNICLNENNEIFIDNDGLFEVTDEMIDMFGEGYTRSEYKKMYEKYEKLKLNYSLQTNIHQEALVTYVRFKVKEEIATASGNVDEAKKWYDAAQNAAEKAKLTPKQLTKADLDSGVNSISELVKAVEQAVDVIQILPRFKYRPNDAPDFNIWCYIDYERRLNGQSPVSYEDIYSFYDKRKTEYIKQNGDPYGIFTYDTSKKNRETVKTFIKVPKDYDDVAGGVNEDD